MTDPSIEQIYVALLNESVDVWRPVRASRVRADIYRISDQDYDSEIETWEFKPGDEVYCELVDSERGKILVAKRKM